MFCDISALRKSSPTSNVFTVLDMVLVLDKEVADSKVKYVASGSGLSRSLSLAAGTTYYYYYYYSYYY